MPQSPPLADRRDPLSAIIARLASAQKSNMGAGGYSRWINRPLGRRFAAVAFKLGMTPNQVTLVSAGFTFAGIVLLAVVPATWWLGLLVTFLLVTGYALDSADGQLARLRGGGSLVGEWLDHVVDCVKCATLHLAVLIGWFRFFSLPSDAMLLVPLAFAAESSIFFFTIILSEQLRRHATGRRMRAEADTDRPPILRSLVVLPADYGLHCWMFVLWGVQAVFIWLYLAVLVLNIGMLAAGLVRWFREMSKLSSARPTA